MMKFIYDSLDTIKGLKHPTVKQYVSLTISIFALVIFVGLFFVLADLLFTSAYNTGYELNSSNSTTESISAVAE